MSKPFRPEDISPHHSPCQHCDSPGEHEPPHFVFGVDLDGVCADLFTGLRPIAAQWTGRPLKSLTKKPSWGLPEWGIQEMPGGYDELHRFAVNRHDLFAKLPPMPGAPQALREFSHLGMRIRIVTHRFYIARSHELAASQTVRWLEDQDIPYWVSCFMQDKQAVDCDAYVDDSSTNVTKVQARFDSSTPRKAQAIFFNPRGDPPPKGALIARNWKDVSRSVRKQFATWQEKQSRKLRAA